MHVPLPISRVNGVVQFLPCGSAVPSTHRFFPAAPGTSLDMTVKIMHFVLPFAWLASCFSAQPM